MHGINKDVTALSETEIFVVVLVGLGLVGAAIRYRKASTIKGAPGT